MGSILKIEISKLIEIKLNQFYNQFKILKRRLYAETIKHILRIMKLG